MAFRLHVILIVAIALAGIPQQACYCGCAQPAATVEASCPHCKTPMSDALREEIMHSACQCGECPQLAGAIRTTSAVAESAARQKLEDPKAQQADFPRLFFVAASEPGRAAPAASRGPAAENLLIRFERLLL